MRITKYFTEFFESEKAGGLILVFATIISLIIANSSMQSGYNLIWQTDVAGHSVVHWINDGLMAIFFLLIGLELEREIYQGELSSFKNASLPIVGALGGMLVPAVIFLSLNWGTPEQSGAGIPMATDIAFAIGILSLLGKKVPASLKVFLTALAVIDDLGAIVVIAIFYTQSLSIANLFIALGIWAFLIGLNRLRINNLLPYLIGGVAMWYFMLHSGVHATITGVLLAFAIPFGDGKAKTPSHKVLHFLHKPVAFFILPLFALANTSIVLGDNWSSGLAQHSSWGIVLGLVFGKPLGITLFSLLGVWIGVCALPSDLKWKSIIGAGMLGGIGFTMSIFITLLAFDEAVIVDNSKIAILIASTISGILGFVWLKLTMKEPRHKFN
jgi:NhaA family Na+:H+ antiporter